VFGRVKSVIETHKQLFLESDEDVDDNDSPLMKALTKCFKGVKLLSRDRNIHLNTSGGFRSELRPNLDKPNTTPYLDPLRHFYREFGSAVTQQTDDVDPSSWSFDSEESVISIPWIEKFTAAVSSSDEYDSGTHGDLLKVFKDGNLRKQGPARLIRLVDSKLLLHVCFYIYLIAHSYRQHSSLRKDSFTCTC